MIDYLLEYVAQTRSEAEKKSLELLQLEAEDVTFESVSTGGLRRFFKSSSVLLRTIPRDRDALSQKNVSRGVLHTLLFKMNVIATIDNIEEKEENVHMRLVSENSALLIGKYGRSLDALQFLLNLLVSKWIKNNKRIILDVGDYRVRREKSIHQISRKVADKVSRTGRSIALNYMSPYERRIVHLFLENDEDVYTESSGTGVYKRVRIFPQRENTSRDNRNTQDDIYKDEIENEEDYDDGNYNESTYHSEDYNDHQAEEDYENNGKNQDKSESQPSKDHKTEE